MKFLITAVSLLILSATGAYAETMYVSEVREISFRTGPGMSHKLIKWLPSGQQIKMIKKGEGWSHVRLTDGQEGWALTRFLTKDKPNRLKLVFLEKKHNLLKEEIDALSRENDRLKIEYETVKQEFQKTKDQYVTLKNAYDTLKTESADFLNLQGMYTESKVKLETQTKKADRLEAKYNKLLKSELIKGGIAGAVILLVGLIVGRRTRRQQRRYMY